MASLYQREENGLPDAKAGEGHQQPVDAHAHAAGGRHAVLEGAQELLVQAHGLRVAAGGEPGLLHEAFALHDGVDELGVPCGQFEAADVEVPLLHDAVDRAVAADQRAGVHREVEHEGGPHQAVLHEVLPQFLDVLAVDRVVDLDLLGGEWDRISMYDSLSAAAGRTITPATPLAELQELAAAEGVEVHLANHGKYVEELWEHFVKESLVRPTFVMDFPVETSPLVRAHRSKAGVVEKWDLYIRGFELATGYSELVDPVVQRERFVEQALLASKGDLEAMRLDEEFLRALEHGMPPSGGMGMGIDRLLMAITGLGIRETILFPLVK